jgi:dTDP-4-amino-4,6-dideoxy-D-glucose acyltransferase
LGTLNRHQIEQMGFASLGENIAISDRASFYNCARISLGSNVRIDDFCVFSAGNGGIYLGNYIHVAVYTSLIGSGMIHLDDFCNLSSKVAIYSSSDDFSGEWMTNPTVPKSYSGVFHADVKLGRHVIVGAGSVILPGVSLGDGVAVGALSLVKNDCEAFGIYAGCPCRKTGVRKMRLLELERQLELNNRSVGQQSDTKKDPS